jgi:16S rRNA processing protein RimM
VTGSDAQARRAAPVDLIDVGEIVGTHGLRGDLKVRLYSGDPAALLAASALSLSLPGGDILEPEVCRRVLHKGAVLLRLRGYEAIALAEPLIGSIVRLSVAALPELGDDEYYWAELEGARVVDEKYGELGQLVRMFTTAAHDTYVVQGRYGEVLIPVVKQFIIAIDPSQGVIRVALPEGLVPELPES